MNDIDRNWNQTLLSQSSVHLLGDDLRAMDLPE